MAAGMSCVHPKVGSADQERTLCTVMFSIIPERRSRRNRNPARTRDWGSRRAVSLSCCRPIWATTTVGRDAHAVSDVAAELTV